MHNIKQIDKSYVVECQSILEASFDTPWKESDSVFLSKSNLILGALLNDRLVGFCVASMVADEGEVLMCAVHPDFQRCGVGGALVGGMLDECHRRKIVKFFLEVDVTNIAAQRLYEKFGFKVMGKRKAYYQKSDGTVSDALIVRFGD